MKDERQVTPRGETDNCGHLMTASILITRPEPAAGEFADMLRTKLGETCTICTSPVMQIEVCANLPDLEKIHTLIFTSRHGVEAFAKLTDRRDIPAYTVGEATGDAAQDIGLSVAIGEGDAERLIKQILADQPSPPCLHMRGEHVATPLAEVLTSAGLETHEAMIYFQKPCPFADEVQQLLKRPGPVILPLFSPRSARLVFEQEKRSEWQAPLHIVAMSQAVARQVPENRASSVSIATKLDAAAMVQATERVWIKANRLEGC
jgi:uroporphyrinogen-III synthase